MISGVKTGCFFVFKNCFKLAPLTAAIDEISVYAVRDLIITSEKRFLATLLKGIQNFCAGKKECTRHPADTKCKVLNYGKMLYYNLKNLENNLAGTVLTWSGGIRVDFIYRYHTALCVNPCCVSFSSLFLSSGNSFPFKMFSLYFPSYPVLILPIPF